MINGTKKFSHKTSGMCDHISRLFVPDSPRHMLYHAGLAGTRHHCYSCNTEDSFPARLAAVNLSRSSYKDASMETYQREESPRFFGGFLYVCVNFKFTSLVLESIF